MTSKLLLLSFECFFLLLQILPPQSGMSIRFQFTAAANGKKCLLSNRRPDPIYFVSYRQPPVSTQPMHRSHVTSPLVLVFPKSWSNKSLMIPPVGGHCGENNRETGCGCLGWAEPDLHVDDIHIAPGGASSAMLSCRGKKKIYQQDYTALFTMGRGVLKYTINYGSYPTGIEEHPIRIIIYLRFYLLSPGGLVTLSLYQ